MSKRIPVMMNPGRSIRVELMAYAGIAAAAGSIWWGTDLLETYGLRPGDGGALRPFGERLMVAGTTAGCGIAFAAGLLIYQSLYVVGMALVGGRFDVHTKIGPLNIIRSYTLDEVTGSTYRHRDSLDHASDGRSIPREYAMTVYVKGRRLPYIFDLHARFVDRAALLKIAPQAVRRWNSDPSTASYGS
jgi:hypothetical protein